MKKWLSIVWMVMTLALLVGVAPASAGPSESNVVHIVQRGETLYSIARRYGVDMWTIARANNIINPNRIYVGQRLVISTGQPVSTGGTVHVVQRGENLFRIALRYGVSTWSIAQANGITNLNTIYVGQRLVIPGASPSPHPHPHPPSPSPQPPSPSSYPGPWSGEYFDNISLTGPAYTTRNDANINFNWGWGSPGGGMPADYFSVRWSGTFSFGGGNYNFYVKADDGVRVYLDGECIIDGWRDGGWRLYATDRSLTAGDHTVRVEYYERSQVARVLFWWDPSTEPAPTPTPEPNGDTGWVGEFYNNEDMAGSPVVTQHAPWIGFDWGDDGPLPGIREDYFSIRWTTTMYLGADHYRFCARSDDGARIWVDGDLVLDEWHTNSGTSYCGTCWLETGAHEVKVEYFEHDGDALIYVWWEPH
jgi:LysM repeat protein